MRCRAMFLYSGSIERFIEWLSSQLTSIVGQSEIEIKQTNHATTISLKVDDQCLEYSVHSVSPESNKICVFVDPQLTFFAAIMGKEDVSRHRAIQLAHKVLSSSSEVSDLGWFLEKQIWKGSTPAP